MAFERAVLRRTTVTAVALALAFGAVTVSGCASKSNVRSMQSQDTGGGGFRLFGGRRGGGQPAATTAIGVNAFLWRASLDTLSFMPLASADPYGGVINTEWYSNPETPNERFKATVYILDTRLRADGVNVSLNRQVRGPAGEWVDAPNSEDTEDSLENAILTRARKLRVGGL